MAHTSRQLPLGGQEQNRQTIRAAAALSPPSEKLTNRSNYSGSMWRHYAIVLNPASPLNMPYWTKAPRKTTSWSDAPFEERAEWMGWFLEAMAKREGAPRCRERLCCPS